MMLEDVSRDHANRRPLGKTSRFQPAISAPQYVDVTRAGMANRENATFGIKDSGLHGHKSSLDSQLTRSIVCMIKELHNPLDRRLEPMSAAHSEQRVHHACQGPHLRSVSGHLSEEKRYSGVTEGFRLKQCYTIRSWIKGRKVELKTRTGLASDHIATTRSAVLVRVPTDRQAQPVLVRYPPSLQVFVPRIRAEELGLKLPPRARLQVRPVGFLE
jgi:hypothetical protein